MMNSLSILSVCVAVAQMTMMRVVDARFGVSEAFGLQGKLTACGLDSASAGDLGGAGIGILLAGPEPCKVNLERECYALYLCIIKLSLL